MKKQDFINFLQSQSNIILSEFFCEKLNSFINDKATKEAELEAIAKKILTIKKKFINDADILEALKLSLWSQASQRAKSASIEKFKGSRFEMQQILAIYFYRTSAKERGLEWIL